MEVLDGSQWFISVACSQAFRVFSKGLDCSKRFLNVLSSSYMFYFVLRRFEVFQYVLDNSERFMKVLKVCSGS